jgi:3',5'-cyclic AMP phosphodiesterase CpdA
MRILIHISDLHFHHVDRATVEALITEIHAIKPHLVVVSGDLTQRARAHQFKEAAEFLERLPFPQVVVPGNHDVPLYNLFARFFSPFSNYRRFINSNLEPVFEDEEMIVLGLCTPQSFTISEGRLRDSSLENFRKYLQRGACEKTRLLVSHHPLEVSRLLPFSPDVLLAGHLHMGSASSTTNLKIAPHRSLVAVQGGTSTSVRHRGGEGNSFNLIYLEKPEIRVEKYEWSPEKTRFLSVEKKHFTLSPEGWLS